MFLCMTSNVRIWCPGNVPCRCPSAPATMSTLPSKIPLGARIEPSGHRLLETGWPFVGIGRVLKGRVGRNFRLHSAGALLTPNSQKVPSKLKCYRSNYRCIGHRVQKWMSGQLQVCSCRLAKCTEDAKSCTLRAAWWGCFWEANWCRPE